MHKLIKIAAIIISVISIVFLALLISGNGSEDNTWISPLIYVSYFIFFACVAVVLLFVLKNLFSNGENLKRTLIAVGLFVGVLILSYVLADGSDVKANGEVFSGATSKWVSTGLNMFYALGLVAIFTMAWAGITKFKK